ncbi:hypothetical protein [Pseudomonas sp. CF161]|uniref:hypothetical protein n=1 Tax=Pseudomonas sp. CF161 TaxID=911241 RepID=UPI000354FFB2|nr:hypothetical protein [Pseudomonas sp. CF161]EPL15040.1 hypothetical protein CF161_06000 [Pseudomonas sp. CF161]
MFKGLLLRTCRFALYSLLLSGSAWASEGKQVFTGTLGQAPIVVELFEDMAGDVQGRYFYRKYHKDLRLEGKREGDALVLEESRWGSSGAHPGLRLEPSAKGWHGEWKGADGKTLKIELSPAQIPPLPAEPIPYLALMHDMAPYDYLRLLELKLKPGKKQHFMGYSLQWWSEPESGATLFEVVAGYPQPALKAINLQLSSSLWQAVVAYHGCLLAGGDEGSFQQTAKPMLLTSSVISVSVSHEFMCGGASPNQDQFPINLDARTGRPLTLEDVMWIAEGEPIHYEQFMPGRDHYPAEITDAYYDYRNTLFGRWLVEYFQELYPRQMKDTGEQGGCDYDNEQRWKFANWYFTAKGLYFNPDFVQAASACRWPSWSYLPYSIVKKTPGGVPLLLPD